MKPGSTAKMPDLNMPEATTATIDADGWLHTSGTGYTDEVGRCFLLDRLKELIKFEGYKVAPTELDALPKSPAGKLLRRELKAREQGGA